MPKPTGPQFKDIAEARAFVESLPDSGGPHSLKSSPEFLNQPTTKALMKTVGIRVWPIDHPAEYRGTITGGEEDVRTVRSNERLNTTQDHLHMAGLKKYISEGPPQFDPAYEEMEINYHPEVLYSDEGRGWIYEGHHRLVASRLNEEPSTKVYAGRLIRNRKK